jgi:hypothetical protein
MFLPAVERMLSPDFATVFAARDAALCRQLMLAKWVPSTACMVSV